MGRVGYVGIRRGTIRAPASARLVLAAERSKALLLIMTGWVLFETSRLLQDSGQAAAFRTIVVRFIVLKHTEKWLGVNTAG